MKYLYIGLTISIIIIIVLACYGFFFQPDKIRQRVEELYRNGKFATGTIVSKGYNTYEYGNTLSSILYKFNVQNTEQRQSITMASSKQISKTTYKIFLRSTGRKAGAAIDAQFLVLYDENNPKNAIILLDHPIKSDKDFERYKAEIEERRKDKSWRGYE
jgi:uncharacterized protein (DUF1778 family)